MPIRCAFSITRRVKQRLCPEGRTFRRSDVTAIGTRKNAEGWPTVEIGPDQTYELRVLVTLPRLGERESLRAT